MNAVTEEQSFKRDQVVEIIDSVVKRMSSSVVMSHDHQDILDEIKRLQSSIDQMRENLSTANPESIQFHIPSATDELDAIVAMTENATHTIMTSCEKIQDLLELAPSSSQHSLIEKEVVNIFEACTFQDLTGQRISKIMSAMRNMDQCARDLAQILNERFAKLENKSVSADDAGEVSLMNGPQLPGQGISQEEIDRLLNDFA